MRALTRAPWFGHAMAGVGLIVALALTNVAWVAPREKERKQLLVTESALRTELSDLQTGIQEMTLWQAAHPGTDLTRGRLKEAQPAGGMVAALLDALGEIGTRYHVRTELIQPAGVPVDEVVTEASGVSVTYRKIDLRLRLEAPYREIGSYLSDVEALDQLVMVRSVALRYEASMAPRLVADVSLWIYGRP